ncbi:1-aminocyclopropane-1-carboxylate deaminase/D-cysteine desulfhydrase [Bacterioplanoides sp.]|uniref:1-aminocyclopropane-1-carboxylate deaminase/D-cysteine desulfhydrase n=1 Tax=Bacterioplanoides sp. TaxID=2066072 RepID=UPI003B59F5C4
MLRQLLQKKLPVEPLPGCQQASVLRLDLLDPVISGNKAYKLLGHIERAQTLNISRIVSFGGPFSNHLHALAAAGKTLGLETVGIVRGYENLPLTATLQDCQAFGMKLVFADKKQYARRYQADYLQQLADEFQAYVVEEGGSGSEGLKGCELLAPYCQEFDQVWLAVGTGTTALGLAGALQQQGSACRLVGVNVVADQGERRLAWRQSMPDKNWQLLDDYHFSGFARTNEQLLQMIREFDTLGLPLDPVYTAKLVYAYQTELQQRAELENQRVLLIHSGGLQGRRGYPL